MKAWKILLFLTFLVPIVAYMEGNLFYAVVERNFEYYLWVNMFEMFICWAGYYMAKLEDRVS
jgi:hypothetical protein